MLGPDGAGYYSTEPLKATLSGREEKMLMKLIVDSESDKVVGCHVLGEDAAEMLLAGAHAVGVGTATFTDRPTAGVS